MLPWLADVVQFLQQVKAGSFYCVLHLEAAEQGAYLDLQTPVPSSRIGECRNHGDGALQGRRREPWRACQLGI